MSWSPDGRQLVFDTDRDGVRQIYMMNENGSGQFNITNTTSSEFFPSWSPDGRRIAFASTRQNRDPDERDRNIYVPDLDTSGVTRLTENDDDWWPSWSPNGTQIAFTTDRGGDAEIYVMDADGGNQANLTNSPAGDFRPMWSQTACVLSSTRCATGTARSTSWTPTVPFRGTSPTTQRTTLRRSGDHEG